MPTDEKKNHDYRVSCLCFYIHVYGIPDYRKRFAWIKPYNDVIYHVLNMKSCCVVLVNYKPIRYFTTNQRYQSSASDKWMKKILFPWHGHSETGCVREWVFILHVASIRTLSSHQVNKIY